MNLVLVGLNHDTAPVEVRECLAPEPERLPAMLEEAMRLGGVREAFMVATCNRVEVLAACMEPDLAESGIRNWLVNGRGMPPQDVDRCLYAHRDRQAVRHIYRVASSLDSMVVGEPQILGQIKQAYRAAAEAGASRTVLNRLFHKTFQVAKRVRTETNIGGAAVSISYAAVELAKKIFGELNGLSVALLGAGEMAELAAEHLLANGVGTLLVANRTLERAVELGRRLRAPKGRAYSLDDLPEVLGLVDIVITSTGSPEPVVTRKLARAALKKRRGRPLFLIDIAVPRDVENAVSKLDGCFVYDIDDLSGVVEANRAVRMREAQQAEHIVAEEVVKFSNWLDSLEVVPTISDLTAKAEGIREKELARSLRDLEGLAPEQAQAVDRLTKALVKKLLHNPILFLKDPAHAKNPETMRNHAALVRRMFKLGENGES